MFQAIKSFFGRFSFKKLLELTCFSNSRQITNVLSSLLNRVTSGVENKIYDQNVDKNVENLRIPYFINNSFVLHLIVVELLVQNKKKGVSYVKLGVKNLLLMLKIIIETWINS